MMTEWGTFIINGTERVIVTELAASPGAYLMEPKDATKQVFTANLMPSRDTWLELEIDKKGIVYARIEQDARRHQGQGGVLLAVCRRPMAELGLVLLGRSSGRWRHAERRLHNRRPLSYCLMWVSSPSHCASSPSHSRDVRLEERRARRATPPPGRRPGGGPGRGPGGSPAGGRIQSRKAWSPASRHVVDPALPRSPRGCSSPSRGLGLHLAQLGVDLRVGGVPDVADRQRELLLQVVARQRPDAQEREQRVAQAHPPLRP